MADLTERDVPVPTKIVIMGTSHVSLNERFSKLTKANTEAPKPIVTPSVASLHRKRSPISQRKASKPKNVIYEDQDEDDLELEDEYEEVIEEYVKHPSRVPRNSRNLKPRQSRPLNMRPTPSRMGRPTYRAFPVAPALPIAQRVSFNKSRVVYVPVQNPQINRGMFKTFRGHTGKVAHQNYRFQNHGGRGGFIQRGGSSSRGIRMARGSGIGGRGSKHQNVPKSQEELDRELDSYMKKSKHPQITVQDMDI